MIYLTIPSSPAYISPVILATDQMNASYGILLLQSNLDKIISLTDHTLLAAAGPNCDLVNFTNHVQQQLALYRLQNHGTPLSVQAQAHYCRNVLATALRRGPYQVECLLGGLDDQTTPSLYWMDYLGTLQKVRYGCQGVATQFCLGIMDQNYKEHLSYEEALNIIQMCLHELHVRFLPQQPNFILKCLDATKQTPEGKVEVQTISFGADPADN
jgi:20S proteasome subunit beta 4